MRRFLVLLLLIFIACMLGGVYGILHDQLTYTISPEYFTKFKFYQFELIDIESDTSFANPRLGVSYVGFMATWWMGLFIGVLLGLTGLIHPDGKKMYLITLQAFLIAILIAFLTGLLGLIYGYFVLSGKPLAYFNHWLIPENLVHFKTFIAVGSMHNYSYLGGLFGLIGGACYSFYKKYKNMNRVKFSEFYR